MLKLNGINFGPIFCATGALGFCGEGYPFHGLLPWKGAAEYLRDEAGFSGKTLTLLSRRGKEFNEPGNMPLKEDGMTPRERLPRCIWVSPFNGGEMINAVGLAGFEMKYYLQTGRYYKIRKPGFISVMLMAADAAGRETELRDICKILRGFLPFSAPIALQINFGCPNSGHDLSKFYAEICKLVELAKALLGIPVVVNCSALMPTPVLIEVSRIADALWIGNTIPFNDPATRSRINWARYGNGSPLARRGLKFDGGLSSPACLPLTLEKVRELRDCGVHIPIVGGNGIRHVSDIHQLHAAGCNAAFIGSVVVVRPHRTAGIVQEAKRIF